jgi:hypothetical protein
MQVSEGVISESFMEDRKKQYHMRQKWMERVVAAYVH